MAAQGVIDRLVKAHREERKRSAAGQVGFVQSPLGSNNVKYNTWYYGHKVQGAAFPWCAAYQSYVMAHVGVPMHIYPKDAGVLGVRRFFQDRNRVFQKPKVGDLVLFVFSADAHHIGFVETVKEDGSFTTIEGNVDSRVMRVPHRQGERGIVGYGRPEYEKVEDDMTKEELRDMLRAALSPGFDTVNEWAAQLNQVTKDVAAIRHDVEELKKRP